MEKILYCETVTDKLKDIQVATKSSLNSITEDLTDKIDQLETKTDRQFETLNNELKCRCDRLDADVKYYKAVTDTQARQIQTLSQEIELDRKIRSQLEKYKYKLSAEVMENNFGCANIVLRQLEKDFTLKELIIPTDLCIKGSLALSDYCYDIKVKIKKSNQSILLTMTYKKDVRPGHISDGSLTYVIKNDLTDYMEL